jgi:hypothetical protein
VMRNQPDRFACESDAAKILGCDGSGRRRIFSLFPRSRTDHGQTAIYGH